MNTKHNGDPFDGMTAEARDRLCKENAAHALKFADQQRQMMQPFYAPTPPEKCMTVEQSLLTSAYTIMANMADERKGFWNQVFRRWVINHEPLRTDAKNWLDRYWSIHAPNYTLINGQMQPKQNAGGN